MMKLFGSYKFANVRAIFRENFNILLECGKLQRGFRMFTLVSLLQVTRELD